LSKKKANIIFLQETYSTKEVEHYWNQQWSGGNILFSHGTNHSKGVAVLFKKNCDYEIKHCKIDQSGRAICLELGIQGHDIIIINVYYPCASKPKDQEALWDKVRNMISEIDNYDEKYIIMGGDFNFLMNLGLDRDGGNPSHNESVKRKINTFLNDFDLIDIWRIRNPYLRQFTWRQKNPLVQSRLDFWLISNNLQDIIKDTGINPAIGTDHSLITVKVQRTGSLIVPCVMMLIFPLYSIILLQNGLMIITQLGMIESGGS
jgi:exonuclease III